MTPAVSLQRSAHATLAAAGLVARTKPPLHSEYITLDSTPLNKALSGTLIISALLVAAGCSRFEKNPFARTDADFARPAPRERLRSVQPADFPRVPNAVLQPDDRTDPVASTTNAVTNRFAGLEKTGIALETVRASALENNLDLRVAFVDPAIAAQRVSEEDARFNAAFTTRANWFKIDDATASTLASAQSEFRSIEPGVRIPTRTGGTVIVSLPVAKQETDNQFATLNPSYTSDLEMSISHNLLRNAGRSANTSALRIAGYNQQISEAQTKLEVIRQLAAVDRAYWRLYQARAELDVRLQQYELSVAQRDRAARRVTAGASAEIEVTRAEAGIADRLEAILATQNILRLQQRELKRIANIPDLGVETTTLIETITLPNPIEYVVDPTLATNAAVANRMEMLALELQLASDAVTLGLQRNRALPLLTLDYTYRVNGLGGSMQDSFRTLNRNKFADWELGLNFELPLDNEEARARIRQALLTRIQRLSSQQAREQSIRQETLNAIDSIEGTWQRILAARQSVILNTRALQAEQRQFDVGRSTSTDVLDAATRVADAQSAEIRALTDHQISQVDLAFATGTLLGAAKVDWSPTPPPDLSQSDPAEADSHR